jgi:hypothetical protein
MAWLTHYIVEGKEAKYLINGSCICPDAANRPELKGLCKHKLAATIYAEQEAIADTPKVAKATTKKPVLGNVEGATTAPSESDRTLGDLLEDMYPKARQTDSLR